jgi:hypothetical protein
MDRPRKILLVGLKSSAVDFEKWPELSVEKLEKAFADIEAGLKQKGYDAHWCLTDSGETAEQQLADAIASFGPDIVLIGAGVRTDPDHLLLFEKMINSIHRRAPQAAIAFNTQPFDTITAVERWL